MIERSPNSPTGAAVLVSGASFAGLATAFWMNRLGYQVTVIEAAGGLRKGGTPVDIEGEAIGTLARMRLIEAVRAKALPPRAFEFKDAGDETLGGQHGGAAGDDAPDERYELHRDDLLDILHASLEGFVELAFDRSIAQLENGPNDVSVRFADGGAGTYALVFGCDGNRSGTRQTAFAELGDVSHFMGGYFAIKVVPVTGLLPANRSQIFSVPGRTALLNGYDDRTDIVLAFRTARELDAAHRDRARQRRAIHDHFDGLGWKIPGMLAHIDADDDFYFDKINQIRMPVWSNGRVALVGDAGYCVSPVAGLGGSVAIIGAARLADALQRHGDDHAAAFRDYEDRLRPFVESVQQRAVAFGMSMMFPSDEAELAERDRKLIAGVMEL